MNAFETYGTSASRPTRRAKAPRSLRRVQEEAAQIRKEARTADKREMGVMLEGPHGAALLELMKRLRGLTFADAPKLLVYVEASPLRRAPENVRWAALRLISKAIARVREREGLAPFDDGLPGDAPKAMHVLKELLGVR